MKGRCLVMDPKCNCHTCKAARDFWAAYGRMLEQEQADRIEAAKGAAP